MPPHYLVYLWNPYEDRTIIGIYGDSEETRAACYAAKNVPGAGPIKVEVWDGSRQVVESCDWTPV